MNWKSKQAAATWSLVPGLGHFYVHEFYVHEHGSGFARASAAASVVPLVIAADGASDVTWRYDWPARHRHGRPCLELRWHELVEEALRGAVKWSEREAAELEDEHPQVP